MAQYENQKVMQVILFKTRRGVSPGKIEEVRRQYERLYGEVRGLEWVKWGANISANQFAEGWTEGCILLFRNKEFCDRFQFSISLERLCFEEEWDQRFYDDKIVYELEMQQELEFSTQTINRY